MSPAGELSGLIDHLRRTHSPIARLRLLADAWKGLRRITPDERARLALELGVDGADEIVERLASARGTHLPGILRDALRALRGADPGDVRRVVEKLRDADGRRELLERGVHAVEGQVVQEDHLQAPWIPGAQPAPTPPRPDASGALVAHPPTPPTPARSSPPSAPRPTQSAVRRPVVPAPSDHAPATGEAARPQPPTAAPPGMAQSGISRPHFAHEESVASARAHADPVPAPTAPRPAAVVGGGEGGAWLSELATKAGPSERLRALRARGADSGSLGAARLEELLDLFPDGWQRRRAVCDLLEWPNLDTAVAIESVTHLGREWDRAWCLSRLLGSHELSAEERGRCLDLVASPAARSRLERRAPSSAEKLGGRRRGR